MANSNTEHSRALRSAAAKKSTKEARISGRSAFYQVSGQATLITAQKAYLQQIPGNSYADKIQFLIDKYENGNAKNS
ncbi:hypothetical protein ACWA5Z_06870 [Testudinibacter sp. P80/BLE/0925]